MSEHSHDYGQPCPEDCPYRDGKVYAYEAVTELQVPAYEPHCRRPGCDLGENGTAWIGTRTLSQEDAMAEMLRHRDEHAASEARLERVSQLRDAIEEAWKDWGMWPARDAAGTLFLALAIRLTDAGWIRPELKPGIMQEMVDAAMGRAPVPLSDLDDEEAPEGLSQETVKTTRWLDGHVHDGGQHQSLPPRWVAHNGFLPHVHDPETGRTLFRGDYNKRNGVAGTPQPAEQDWRLVP